MVSEVVFMKLVKVKIFLHLKMNYILFLSRKATMLLDNKKIDGDYRFQNRLVQKLLANKVAKHVK